MPILLASYTELRKFDVNDIIPTKYHTYDELTTELKNINNKWPSLTRLYSLAEPSVMGRNLWVLQISTDIKKKEREKLKPMVKYVANMHGDEAVGRELLLSLAKYLLIMYNSGDKNELHIQKLLNETDIHIMPSMNPDGFENATDIDCHGGGQGTTINYKCIFGVFIWRIYDTQCFM